MITLNHFSYIILYHCNSVIQQMFIISHVDDVRSSPIFSSVIRITEGANGSSQIEDATVAASFDE